VRNVPLLQVSLSDVDHVDRLKKNPKVVITQVVITLVVIKLVLSRLKHMDREQRKAHCIQDSVEHLPQQHMRQL